MTSPSNKRITGASNSANPEPENPQFHTRSVSEEQTIEAGKLFAAQLQRGDIVLLSGDLGAGKTHFAKGIAEFFDIPHAEVQSPTFTLIHEYQGRIPVYHLDCYRLNHPDEALEFGLDEYLYGNGITLIEWPEKIAGLLPDGLWQVSITHVSEQIREISIHRQD
ncbi:tRNA (adenosine(37)-N6)-threonylcarbamoyltransferase complex ATPase subunit type 1 TsaE [Natronogracilivirga saccharolytica]|uniref:tRNA threonylcarbamoyladenosine biosynthesis protein TsaE n=1 Tax=Natronogracilivirga saccharolytica TaxID=2812953 RepID=A0A8J7RS96_9BACT|nr:tRNA (adenosine(37)-N6)-threonylcarbamoyltransferase complex ATPase subunit type 1 TsaE [Natronogracilivirga saccharolytica]MBP3192839.1 tRNA (adenosine(37)-N6)-threonylcarbamoyltransferase complex ATPase subunit type 1 TsaE [Natronogracilivirga saccharolytica]